MPLTTIPISDIDIGALPDRTNKTITLRCITLPYEIKDDTVGNVFDFGIPVRIEVFVRDSSAIGKKKEPTNLVELEKYLVDFLTINKFGLQEEGISHIIVTDSQTRPIGQAEYGLNNWYKLMITVKLYYRMKFVVT